MLCNHHKQLSMLKQIRKIRSIGRFYNFDWHSKDFTETSIIFGNNGNGKSTLTAIFRSADLNNPKYIPLAGSYISFIKS